MQRHKIVFTICFGLALMVGSTAAVAQYSLRNLDSNQIGGAKFGDPLQVNGWGLAYGSGGPFWVSDEGSGWSTLYNGEGVKQGLEVSIPSASGAGPGQPTGIVTNASSDFQIGGWPTFFLFVTLDGTISGWAPKTNFNDAVIAVNNSAEGASYTGLAVTNRPSGNLLYAANLVKNVVEVYDGSFSLVNTFTDPTLGPDYAIRHSGHKRVGLCVVCPGIDGAKRSDRYFPRRWNIGESTGSGQASKPALGLCGGTEKLWPAEQHPAGLKQYQHWNHQCL